MKKLAFLLILFLQACSNGSMTSPDSNQIGGVNAPNHTNSPAAAPTSPGYIVRLGNPTGDVSDAARLNQTRAVGNFSALLNRTDAKPVTVYRTLLGRAFNGVAVDITPEEARKLEAAGFVVQKDYVMVAASNSIGRNDLIALRVPDPPGGGGGGGAAPNKTPTPTPTPTPTATAAPLTGLGSRIAIIDSGVDFRHADFATNGVTCTSISPITNCPKFLDYVSFLTGSPTPSTMTTNMDDFGHGTHVASIAAGVNGVAPGARIAAYKVLDSTGYSTASIIMNAVNYAIGKVDIINLSLRVADNDADAPLLNEAIQNAITSGIVPVIAAGNNGRVDTGPYKTILTPGVMANALTVGAANSTTVADFSSKGPANILGFPLKPDVVAPGVGVCGAALANQNMYPNFTPPACDATHYKLSGTSMAAPYLAGAVALLKQKYSTLTPALTPAELKSIVTLSAHRTGPTYQTYSSVGHGVNPDGGYSFAYTTETCTAITTPPSISNLTAVLDIPTTAINAGIQYTPSLFQGTAVLRPDDGTGKPDGNTTLATGTLVQTSLMNQLTSSGTGQQVWYSFEATPLFSASTGLQLTSFPAAAQWLCAQWNTNPAVGLGSSFLFTVPYQWEMPDFADYAWNAMYFNGETIDPPISGYSATSPAMRLQLRTTRTGTSYDYGAGGVDIAKLQTEPIAITAVGAPSPFLTIKNFGVVRPNDPAITVNATIRNLTTSTWNLTIAAPYARNSLNLLKQPGVNAGAQTLVTLTTNPTSVAANSSTPMSFTFRPPQFGSPRGYYEGEITVTAWITNGPSFVYNIPYTFVFVDETSYDVAQATILPDFNVTPEDWFANFETQWSDANHILGDGSHAYNIGPVDLWIKAGHANDNDYLFVGGLFRKPQQGFDGTYEFENIFAYFDEGTPTTSFDRILKSNQEGLKGLQLVARLDGGDELGHFSSSHWTTGDAGTIGDQMVACDDSTNMCKAGFKIRLNPNGGITDLKVAPGQSFGFNLTSTDPSNPDFTNFLSFSDYYPDGIEFDPKDATTYKAKLRLPSTIPVITIPDQPQWAGTPLNPRSPNSMTASWTMPTPASPANIWEWFELQWKTSIGDNDWTGRMEVPANTMTTEVANLDAGVSSDFRVRACNKSGCSNFSPSQSNSTPSGSTLRIVETATGNAHSCFLYSDGKVGCAGNNVFGQLGNHTFSSMPTTTPVIVKTRLDDIDPDTQEIKSTTFPPLSGIIHITAGSYFTCALDKSAHVYCWGEADSGQIGLDPSQADNCDSYLCRTYARALDSLSDVVAISAGGDSACIVRRPDRSAWCWGAGSKLGDMNGYGGRPGTVYTATPVLVADNYRFRNISVGGDAVCGIISNPNDLSNATAVCWGYSAEGVFGDGYRQYIRNRPGPVHTVSKLIALSVGDQHACGVVGSTDVRSPSGALYCWGADAHGQVGDNGSASRLEPYQVLPGTYTDVQQASAGSARTCAVRSGQVYCWGLGDFGGFGDGTPAVVNPPAAGTNRRLPSTAATGIGDAMKISSLWHSCAPLDGGGAKCWGEGDYGQLGNGLTLNKATPAIVQAREGTPEPTAKWSACIARSDKVAPTYGTCADYCTKVLGKTCANTCDTDLRIRQAAIAWVAVTSPLCGGANGRGEDGSTDRCDFVLNNDPTLGNVPRWKCCCQ